MGCQWRLFDCLGIFLTASFHSCLVADETKLKMMQEVSENFEVTVLLWIVTLVMNLVISAEQFLWRSVGLWCGVGLSCPQEHSFSFPVTVLKCNPNLALGIRRWIWVCLVYWGFHFLPRMWRRLLSILRSWNTSFPAFWLSCRMERFNFCKKNQPRYTAKTWFSNEHSGLLHGSGNSVWDFAESGPSCLLI